MVAACVTSPAPATTTTTIAAETTTTTRATTTTTEPPPEPFVYRVGLTQAPTTDNFWAYFDPQSPLPEQYVIGTTKPSLYVADPPAFELAPYLAAGDGIAAPVETELGWQVTVDLLPDAVWNDGVPITADDVVFTFQTVRDLGLGGGWAAMYPVVEPGSEELGLVDVEAVDVDTVRFLFNGRPGLPYWPNGPGTAPIMPRHFWQDAVTAALQTADPARTLASAPGEGDPSGGPVIVADAAGTSPSGVPNPSWVRSGTTVRSGDETYELGPFFERMEFTIYPDQRAAAEGLAADEIDIVLDPAGLDPATRSLVDPDEGIRIVENQVNGFRYAAFNLRRVPMSDLAFRDALELMNDRDAVAGGVFGGEATPAIVSIADANETWFDPETVEELWSGTASLDTDGRLTAAVELLRSAGYAWDRPPTRTSGQTVPGEGLTRQGEPVPPIEILSPTQELDPLRATYALWIERWLTELGFEASVRTTDFAGLVQQVFTPVADGTDIDFDIVILGWRLPNQGIPLHHASFWASFNDTLRNDGNNNTGFADARFDAFVNEYNASRDADEAYAILWEMEKVLYEQKPYLILFDTDIYEAYRSDHVQYPFVDVLSGLQSVKGMPAMVQQVDGP